MDNGNISKTLISVQQKVYGTIVHWITIFTALIAMIAPVFVLANPQNNVSNPYKIFDLIFQGKDKDFIWQNSGASFPGGHFYLTDILKGDAIAQFGIALGCSVALWSFIPTVILYIKSKDYVFAGICLFDALLILLALTGVLA